MYKIYLQEFARIYWFRYSASNRRVGPKIETLTRCNI